MFMRETAAVRAVQTIHQMQVQYQSQYGRFANSLTELGPPQSGAASPASADLIGRDLSEGEKQGYRFTLTGGQGKYVVNANPVTYGTSGSKSFYSDETMVIRETHGPEPATATSPEMGATAK
jgi:type IV pilus assembly protein PilA